MFQNFKLKSDSVKSWQIGYAIVMAPNQDIAYKILQDTYHEAVGTKDQYKISVISGPAVITVERMAKLSGTL